MDRENPSESSVESRENAKSRLRRREDYLNAGLTDDQTERIMAYDRKMSAAEREYRNVVASVPDAEGIRGVLDDVKNGALPASGIGEFCSLVGFVGSVEDEALREALRSLDGADAEIVYLAYGRDVGPADMALALGVGIREYERRLRKILETLRSRMENFNGEEKEEEEYENR